MVSTSTSCYFVDLIIARYTTGSSRQAFYSCTLEERLSNTYNQHSIGGYNLPPQRNTSGIYPSLTSEGPSGAESYYTGNAQPEPQHRPQSTYYAPPQQQYHAGLPMDHRTTAQEQYPQQSHPAQQHNAAAWQHNDGQQTPTPANLGYPNTNIRSNSFSQYPLQNQQVQPPQPQGTPGWQPTDAPAQYTSSHPPTYAPEHSQQEGQTTQASQPPMNYSDPSLPPSTADPNTYNNPLQTPPAPYVPTESPQQFASTPAQQQPVSPLQTYHQPTKPQQTTNQVPQQQAGYWQGQSQTAAPPQSWQPPNSTYGGYTQNSFPSAPHHAPQQPVVEEALIEL